MNSTPDRFALVKEKMALTSASHWEPDLLYLQKLKNETKEELRRFCDLFFKVRGNLEDIDGSRKALKNAAKKILNLESDNIENLLEYIEYLIKNRHLYYFVIIHYYICSSTGKLKKEFEVYYKTVHLSAVNTVYDIIPYVSKKNLME